MNLKNLMALVGTVVVLKKATDHIANIIAIKVINYLCDDCEDADFDDEDCDVCECCAKKAAKVEEVADEAVADEE